MRRPPQLLGGPEYGRTAALSSMSKKLTSRMAPLGRVTGMASPKASGPPPATTALWAPLPWVGANTFSPMRLSANSTQWNPVDTMSTVVSAASGATPSWMWARFGSAWLTRKCSD
jgi:hypothetical protein